MWKTYYASIFNPARLKVGAMLKEMPKKYWRNMPETSLVQPLIASARARELEMIDRAAAKSGLQNALEAEHRVEPGGNLRASWEALMKEARGCTRCDLYKHATQTVFGEGPLDATIMFVGEQPGDQEDLAGRPFVGPAGQVFDEALEKAGIDRARTSTSPMRSSISSSSSAARSASTASRTRARSRPAAGGSSRNAR